MTEPVIIGDATLCGSSFRFHMTRLAKANEIVQRVGLRSRCKQPERPNVVNRNGRADDYSAVLTCPTVTAHRRHSSGYPLLASVRRDAAYPMGGFVAGEIVARVGGAARLGAKPQSGFGSILAHEPWFDLESTPAMGAIKPLSGHSVQLAGHLARKSIRRAKTSAPPVASFMIAGHAPVVHMPSAPAGKATESRLCRSVRLNAELRPANLACLSDHTAIVPQNIGNGTMGIAYRQPRLFADPVVKPKQEAMPL